MRRALALAIVASLFSSAPARAQSTDLGGGWIAYRADWPFGMPNAIACNSDYAYARDGMGRIARFGAARVELLPEMDPTSSGGDTLDVTESGVLFTATATVSRLEGSSWSTLPISVPAHGVLAIDRTHALAASDGAVVGIDFGRGTAERYDVGTWRSLLAIDGTGRDFWVVGQGGTALHWTHGTIEPHPVGRDVWLEGVTVAAPDDVWAWSPEHTRRWEPSVSGLFHWDGHTWTEHSIAGVVVSGVVADATNALAITETAIYRWSGSAWDQVLSTPERRLTTGCRTRENAFIIDARGAVLIRHWP